MDEQLRLHHVEFPEPENSLPRRYLIPKRAPHLDGAKWQLLPAVSVHLGEVHEHALGSLRPEVCDLSPPRTYRCLEHKVETLRRSRLPAAFEALRTNLLENLAQLFLVQGWWVRVFVCCQMIGSIGLATAVALNIHVREGVHMSGSFEDGFRGDDGTVDLDEP